MKKIISLLLLATLALGVASCKKNNNEPPAPTPQADALEGTSWQAQNVPGVENDATINMTAEFAKGGLMKLIVNRQAVATAEGRNTTTFEAKYTYKRPLITITDMKMTHEAGDPLLTAGAKKSIIEIFTKGGELMEVRPGSIIFNKQSNLPITLIKVEKK